MMLYRNAFKKPQAKYVFIGLQIYVIKVHNYDFWSKVRRIFDLKRHYGKTCCRIFTQIYTSYAAVTLTCVRQVIKRKV